MFMMKKICMKIETAVLAFTGSLKAQCSNNITRDIQLSNFLTNDDIIIFIKVKKLAQQL